MVYWGGQGGGGLFSVLENPESKNEAGKGKESPGDRRTRELSDQVPTELKADKSKGENHARTWEKRVPGRRKGNILAF